MQTNNTFNFTRIGILFRQSAVHHYRLALTSLVAFSGALFIILVIIHLMNDLRSLGPEGFIVLFFVVFGVTTVASAGTAFPNLRTREKMHNYLLVPASSLEKFLVEFVWRIVIIALVVPFVYWVVYNLEGVIINAFFPVYSFSPEHFSDFPKFTMATETATVRMQALAAVMGLLALVIPFTGATIFTRYPLIKSLFAVAVIVFFNIFLMYFFLELLDFNDYHPTTPIFFIRHLEDGLLVSIVASLIFTAGLLAAAYYKIREREV